VQGARLVDEAAVLLDQLQVLLLQLVQLLLQLLLALRGRRLACTYPTQQTVNNEPCTAFSQLTSVFRTFASMAAQYLAYRRRKMMQVVSTGSVDPGTNCDGRWSRAFCMSTGKTIAPVQNQ